MKRLLVAGVLAIFIVFGLWFLAVPEDLIKVRMERLGGDCLQVEVADVRKGLFYNFGSQRITLRRSADVLLFVDNFKGRINLFSLFRGRLTLFIQGDVSGGTIEGVVDLLGGRDRVDLRLDHSSIEGIPWLARIGLRGKGILSAELRLDEGAGDLQFSVRDARFENTSSSGLVLPLDWFEKVKGTMAVRGNSIRVKFLSLEGEEIYARVKGEIVEGKMDLVVELMPDSSFMKKGKGFLFSAIEHYKVSPGHYLIPIKSSISL
jgi:type II secretion system protein N